MTAWSTRWAGVGTGQGQVVSTAVGAGGTATVDGTNAATNVTLTGSANVLVTMPPNGSTVVRIIQGGAGGYTPTFQKPGPTSITWATDQPSWSTMAAGDVVEVRVWTVAGAYVAEWGYDIPALKTRTTALETTAAKSTTIIAGIGTGVTNSNVETTAKTATMAAGLLAADDVVEFDIWWRLAANSGTPTFTFRLKIDSTTILSLAFANIAASSSVGRVYNVQGIIAVVSNTSVNVNHKDIGSTAAGNGAITTGATSSGAAAAGGQYGIETAVTVPDLSSSRTLSWTGQWSAADSSYTFTPTATRVSRRRA